MNKTTHFNKNMPKKSIIVGGTIIGLALSIIGISTAYAAITSQLDFGDRGPEVTELQTYLSTSASIYPSGLVTGYFGELTRAGVQRFQAAQGIVSQGTPATTGYGRVGPQTMARINSLMGSVVSGNTGNQIYWDTAPVINGPSVQVTNTTVTITWTTNEATQGHVYWDKMPLRADEATGPRQQPFVSGTLALDAGGLQTNHSVTISNLQANTTYYYLVRGVDNVGNLSMTWPSSFRTNQ